MVHTEPITLKHLEKVEQIRKAAAHTASSHAFISLFIWKESMKLRIHLEEDGFLIRCGWKGDHAWFFPCGDQETVLRLVDQCLEEEKASGQPFTFWYMREEDKVLLEKNYPGQFRMEERPEDSEYLYDCQAFTAMKGKKYNGMKNPVNRILREHRMDWKRITKEDMETVRKISEASQPHEPSPAGLEDRVTGKLVLDYWDSLGFSGILITADGKPCSAMGGFPLSETIFDMAFTCQSEAFPGLAVYTKQIFVRSLPEQYTIFNAEEDLGVPGLRLMKNVMRPQGQIRMYEGRSLR